MLKQVLVFLLIVLIASNFGCTRLQFPKLNAENILDSCKVRFISGYSDGNKGYLIVKENSVLFKSENKTSEIPASSLLSFGQSDAYMLDFKSPLSMNNAMDCPDGRGGFPWVWAGLIAIVALVVALILTGTFSGNQVFVGMDYVSDGVKNFTTLQISKKDFDRIYPLLLEKMERK